MYLDGLDELDQKIIRLLIENARISYSDIGEETGISRVAVKARIQALEKRGVIEEYTTIINPQKISGAVSCYFKWNQSACCKEWNHFLGKGRLFFVPCHKPHPC